LFDSAAASHLVQHTAG